MLVDYFNKKRCPMCKEKHSFVDEGHEIHCKECGLVVYEVYPYTAGFRLNVDYPELYGENKSKKYIKRK